MLYNRTRDNVLLTHYQAHTGPETSVHMTKETGITDTFAVATAKGDQTATVTNGAQWSVGNKVKIRNSLSENSEYDIVTIKVIATNVLTFDRPLDIGHGIGTDVIGVTQNMAVDGSSTPQTFFWKPEGTDEITHIHAIHIIFASATEPSLELFGANAALTYGAHFKIARASGRDDTYWIPIRSMNALLLSGFTYTKSAKVGGGLWFAHLTINLVGDNNTIILLDGAKDEQFECTIRDLATTNTSMEVKLSIHSETRH